MREGVLTRAGDQARVGVQPVDQRLPIGPLAIVSIQGAAYHLRCGVRFQRQRILRRQDEEPSEGPGLRDQKLEFGDVHDGAGHLVLETDEPILQHPLEVQLIPELKRRQRITGAVRREARPPDIHRERVRGLCWAAELQQTELAVVVGDALMGEDVVPPEVADLGNRDRHENRPAGEEQAQRRSAETAKPRDEGGHAAWVLGLRAPRLVDGDVADDAGVKDAEGAHEAEDCVASIL
mmetsp:Transcript_143433/g.357401  ORF Transcript_143433/g.357401 Transcript_143433/m.357401 type:complete len:236 (+) Transcript_143433:459-1166(+)